VEAEALMDIWTNQCVECGTHNPSLAKQRPATCSGCGKALVCLGGPEWMQSTGSPAVMFKKPYVPPKQEAPKPVEQPPVEVPKAQPKRKKSSKKKRKPIKKSKRNKKTKSTKKKVKP
jgi:hypothetical protein